MVEGLGATNRMGSREQLARMSKRREVRSMEGWAITVLTLYIVTTLRTQKDWATGLFYLKKGKIK